MSAGSDIPEWVLDDPTRLKQIFMNLISNACKFTEKGYILVRLLKSNDGIQIEVEDSGVGIPWSAQDKIFDPFTQADETTTRGYGGTGLGLAICQQLIQLMKGEISCQSRLGREVNLQSTFHSKNVMLKGYGQQARFQNRETNAREDNL